MPPFATQRAKRTLIRTSQPRKIIKHYRGLVWNFFHAAWLTLRGIRERMGKSRWGQRRLA
jgi:hypothetical protein